MFSTRHFSSFISVKTNLCEKPFIEKWVPPTSSFTCDDLFSYERFCARTRFKKGRKRKLVQGLFHQCIRISHTYDSVIRCPQFRILYPTRKTQTPRDCFNKKSELRSTVKSVRSYRLNGAAASPLWLLIQLREFKVLVICFTRNELKSCYNRNFTTERIKAACNFRFCGLHGNSSRGTLRLFGKAAHYLQLKKMGTFSLFYF